MTFIDHKTPLLTSYMNVMDNTGWNSENCSLILTKMKTLSQDNCVNDMEYE